MVQRIIVADRAVGTAALDRESGTETRHRHADRRTSSQTRTHARIHRTAAGAAALNAKLLLQSVARQDADGFAGSVTSISNVLLNQRANSRSAGRSVGDVRHLFLTAASSASLPRLPPPAPRLLAASRAPVRPSFQWAFWAVATAS